VRKCLSRPGFDILFSEKMKSLRGLKNKTTDKDLAKDPTTTCQVNFAAHELKVQEKYLYFRH